MEKLMEIVKDKAKKTTMDEQEADPKMLEAILSLFHHPLEPVFMPKGNIVFNIPVKYLPLKYHQIIDKIVKKLQTKFVGETISIDDIPLPNLRQLQSLGRKENFSLFIPYHRKLAANLIDSFMSKPALKDFLAMCVCCRDHLNPYLFNYAYSVAILHRPDTRSFPIPALFELFPAKFCASSLTLLAKEASLIPKEEREPIEIPMNYTASDVDKEHRLAYFREDIGINLHHWHWHLVYPFETEWNIVNKDRRGELFYYMHQQIIARYNFERFSNNLSRVKRFINWHEPIPEGYFPKLDSMVSSRVWAGRPADTKIQNIYREIDRLQFDIQDLERWRERLYDAIHTASVINEKGETIELTEFKGIDILGNLIESSVLSLNKKMYGDLHNLGHLAIAYAHDPDNRHLETFGVMGDSSTAMRDPIFYRWHSFIDDIFQEHKNTLPPYTEKQLNFPGITVESVEIFVEDEKKDELNTFWQKSDVDISLGLDFSPSSLRGTLLARFTHLQHKEFSYRIKVVNNGNQRKGTVRIFLAPKLNESGVEFSFSEQKNFFIELDKFVLHLEPGSKEYPRKSTESSVTIPFEKTFRKLDAERSTGGIALEKFNFCGCGWPQHMLIPKGSPGGLPCQLFVMVSNYEDDDVGQANSAGKSCEDAASYCGIRDQLYPDKRAMGFPFDRQPRDGVTSLETFLTTNMKIHEVKIKFKNDTS